MRSTTVVYRRNRQALSTARFCRAGQLTTMLTLVLSSVVELRNVDTKYFRVC